MTKLKEWLLRKMIRIAINSRYLYRIFEIVIEEHKRCWYEDNFFDLHDHIMDELKVAFLSTDDIPENFKF